MAAAVERGDLKAVIKGLTPLQRRFAEEYAIDMNGSASAVRAGYNSRYPDKQAYTLMKHQGVAAYINHLLVEKTASMANVTIDKEFVISKILKAMNIAEDKENLTALLKASELLARHLGMLTDKQEITGKDGGALRVEQQRIAETAESFTTLINNLRERALKSEPASHDEGHS